MRGMTPPPFTRPFTHTLHVAFDDIDAAGIVYFARVLDYCHHAWEAFLRERGLPLPSILAGTWGAPVVHAECDYAKPLRHGDALCIEVVTERIGETSFAMAYVVRGADAGDLRARARIVHVTLELPGFRKIPVPEPFRALLADDQADAAGRRRP